MELKHPGVTHMNAGDGDTSYANNSSLQKVVISKTWAVLDETIKDMLNKNGFPKRIFRIADLGCSSGPNTLFLISHIMDTIDKELLIKNQPAALEFEVFLNDLPDNDFNNLFKLLLPGKEKKSSPCFIYGVPGSFYGRLFPTNSLHFAFSSYSLHWLSQIPQEVGVSNKENIYITPNSPPKVCAAYAKQFEMDFSRFLSMRSQEIKTSGVGRMVLAFVGRSVADPSSRDEAGYLTMLAQTLADMAAHEGLVVIRKDDLYSFNMPFYTPCLEEIEAIIGDEGSFVLDKMEVVRVPWDAHKEYDKNTSAKLVTDCVRAFTEPMLASHFGSSVCDQVFDRYAEKMAEHLSKDRSSSSYFTPIISLTRK